MLNVIEQMLSSTTMRPPCSQHELVSFRKLVGMVPHDDYMGFMTQHNGCDGPVGVEGYLCLWPFHEVVSGTKEAGADEFAPGLLLFAGDGGNEAFAFDTHDPRWPIVMVPLVGLSRKDTRYIASTFTEFIQRLAADEIE